MELKKYDREPGEFISITDIDYAERHCQANQHVWFISNSGDARQAKVNGKVRRWRRDRERIEIPLKYGMYEYTVFTASDIKQGRLIKEVTI